MSSEDMKWVLAAVDGSSTAHDAARRAAVLAEKLEEGLLLIHVVEPVPAVSAEVAPVVEISNQRETWARGYLDGLTRELARPGLEIGSRVMFGTPVEILCQLAQRSDVDLMVVGCHQRGALARFFLGSVSTRLSHVCPKPLLIVRHPA